jgi:hypothetical protein
MFSPLLTLTRIEADRFEGPPSPDRSEPLFGGQFLA